MNPTPPAPPPTDADLNRMCADEMGWKKVYRGPEPDDRYIDPSGRYSSLRNIPNYTSDPSAALMLVDALEKEGFDCKMGNYPEWWCEFNRAGYSRGRPIADTLPRAITRAFLKVKGRIQ